ncbi:hypothetical protein GP486_003569 [Trichoglossum hirsutum]|uniref:Uncharacterized protein n=1 Tax=Trichoglossum hirsutum TaxID=265104 RepID=A0A9P8LCD2_9PEZI|nr:hypothetical protein GP486_003569 [Trichoglossum hirsutum]
MDDWGSPWADDAGSRHLSFPRAVVPVESEQGLSNGKLGVQSTGNVLTDLDRSSPWVGDGGLGQWANLDGSTAPIVDAFPDWNAEVSTRIPLSQGVGEKSGGNVQNELESVWGNEVDLPLAATEGETQWTSEPYHGKTEPRSDTERETRTFPEGDKGGRGVDIPHVPLDSRALSTDQKQSTAVTDHRTKPPVKENFAERDLSLRPSSPPACDKYTEAEVADSPRTSSDEIVAFEERKLRFPSPQRPTALINGPVPLKEQGSADDGDVDFGDFEEEVKYTEDRNSNLESHPTRNSMPHGHSKQEQEASATAKPPVNSEAMVFAVDTSLLDRLIPQSYPVDLPPPIEDEVISSTSSRKTWYRISRKETVREHNGNSDYVRVTWAGSSIQANVIKIVARWITEDRIAGGAVFGVSNRLGATFKWGEEMRRASEKPQLGHQEDLSDSPSPSLGKTLSLKITPHPPPPVTPKSNKSSATNSPFEGSINAGMGDTSPQGPQFGWGNSDERVKRLALDATRSTTSTHQKAASMVSNSNSVSPVRSLNPLSATSSPPLQPRPASLDLPSEKIYKSLHTRGSKSVTSSKVQSPRITSSTLPATKAINLTSQGASSIRDSSQCANKAELGTPEEYCNPWAPADPPIFRNRPPTQTSQLSPQTRRELIVVGIPKPKRTPEDEIAERVIRGLPDLAYMLR